MSYQKCPICDGLGTVPPPQGLTNISMKQCSVCNGKKIISILTGFPPGYDIARGIGRSTNSEGEWYIPDGNSMGSDNSDRELSIQPDLFSKELLDGAHNWVQGTKK